MQAGTPAATQSYQLEKPFCEYDINLKKNPTFFVSFIMLRKRDTTQSAGFNTDLYSPSVSTTGGLSCADIHVHVHPDVRKHMFICVYILTNAGASAPKADATRCNTHGNTHGNTHSNTHGNTHCNAGARASKADATHCNTHGNTHGNTQQNTRQHTAKHTATHTEMQVQEHQKLMQHTATHPETHTATHAGARASKADATHGNTRHHTRQHTLQCRCKSIKSSW